MTFYEVVILQGNDLILCQITSKNVKDDYAIPVEQNDFTSGSLNQTATLGPTDFLQQTIKSFCTG